MNFTVTCPVNSVSFGLCSYNILKELYNRGLSPNVFLLGGLDLNSFDKASEDFKLWLQSGLQKALKNYKKDQPEFRLWHIQNSEMSHGSKQSLLTFYETDQPTDYELNILRNQNKVLVTSNYTKEVFEDNGLTNAVFCPLGFDSENFRKVEINKENVVNWCLMGKWEPSRKKTDRVIKNWLKKYGNDRRHKLHLHCFNGFLDQNDHNRCTEINKQLVLQCFEGKQYWNVNVINGHLKSLTEYNKLVNNCDIFLDGSGNENWNLPGFHAVGLGKHIVTVWSNGVKDWANDDNAVLVHPSSKQECYDNMFFNKGHIFSQGNFFNYTDDEFVVGMEKALERFQRNPVNETGLKIKEDFTYTKTVDIILDSLK